MYNFQRHLIPSGSKIKDALIQLDTLAEDAILFIVDKVTDKLSGSLTDGDVRRGLIKGLEMADGIDQFIQKRPKCIRKGDYEISDIIDLRIKDFRLVPVIDKNDKVVNVINFRLQRSYLPIDAIIMAGGRGERLKPLTDKTPKPLLRIGEKPIIEHNFDRLRMFGIDDFWISLRYLGEQVEDHFGNGSSRGVKVKYIWETEPLGTIGAARKIESLNHDVVLVTNSDLLTDLDYEDFYLDFLEKDADLAIACIPYKVNIPYAVMETNGSQVTGFKEKPTYTHYSNGGIYLLKKELLEMIPKDGHFNATDLMEKLINDGLKVISYPFMGYWLDIGKHDDFNRAQEDVKHLNL